MELDKHQQKASLTRRPFKFKCLDEKLSKSLISSYRLYSIFCGVCEDRNSSGTLVIDPFLEPIFKADSRIPRMNTKGAFSKFEHCGVRTRLAMLIQHHQQTNLQ